MMAASFTNREKITIKQVEVNMADKIKILLESLTDENSKNSKNIKSFSMLIVGLGLWLVSYSVISILFNSYFGFDSDVMGKIFNMLVIGGGITLLGSITPWMFRQDKNTIDAIYNPKKIKQKRRMKMNDKEIKETKLLLDVSKILIFGGFYIFMFYQICSSLKDYFGLSTYSIEKMSIFMSVGIFNSLVGLSLLYITKVSRIVEKNKMIDRELNKTTKENDYDK
ncbi:hypothetical protein PSS62_22890 [Enterobacter hormaechei subsp. xiangfangensis]|uniref:hypothetical protein n=1 Tax=Enterobacter hormaechei TaxID=158836 RepID=UPI00287549EA|nr:hypothetical protein [Enterobacter hormaechei]MDR9924797.1 hypothetical protein [Enterobacter hormaechei subsp. xiangfangensis]